MVASITGFSRRNTTSCSKLMRCTPKLVGPVFTNRCTMRLVHNAASFLRQARCRKRTQASCFCSSLADPFLL